MIRTLTAAARPRADVSQAMRFLRYLCVPSGFYFRMCLNEAAGYSCENGVRFELQAVECLGVLYRCPCQIPVRLQAKRRWSVVRAAGDSALESISKTE